MSNDGSPPGERASERASGPRPSHPNTTQHTAQAARPHLDVGRGRGVVPEGQGTKVVQEGRHGVHVGAEARDVGGGREGAHLFLWWLWWGCGVWLLCERGGSFDDPQGMDRSAPRVFQINKLQKKNSSPCVRACVP